MNLFPHIIFGQCDQVLLGILHILIEAGDDDVLAGLVTREADVHLEALHHLGDGLATGTNQTAVDTRVNVEILSDLLFLEGGRGKGLRN